MHKIEVEEIDGRYWRVWYLDEVLIERCREPLFEVCRALQSKGLNGTVWMFSKGGKVARMKVDIDAGAKLTVIEPDKGRVSIVKYRPIDKDTFAAHTFERTEANEGAPLG